MAKRTYYVASDQMPFVIEKEVEFKYEPGFAISQFHKSVRNLHAAIRLREGEKRILEVSTKSEEPLGITLSAFNLHYRETGFRLENVFQSSKVFVQNGIRKGPYRELLAMNPVEAKKSNLLRQSGPLYCFEDLDGREWALEPKTAYYDWIYILSLRSTIGKNEGMYDSLVAYNIFTDIAFVPEKSINCQARALAMYVGMLKAGKAEYYLSSVDTFLRTYQKESNDYEDCEQLTMF